MDTKERDLIIAKLLDEGMSLSDVQKTLETEHDLKLTYMELRMISSDLQVDWAKHDPVVEEPDEEASDEDDVDVTEALEEAVAEGPAGGTTVTVSPVVRPGALFSGDVHFGSGASGQWSLDQYGQLSFNPDEGSGQPTPEDIQEFQTELQSQLQGKM